MRITGGIHRSRKLDTPQTDAVRPTSDKVRQAVFNMLNARGLVRDAIVLDAFCGTGALGLEALSQGAAHCTFFDSNKKSIELCKTNIQSLGEENRTTVILQNTTKVWGLPNQQKLINLLFLDPPYKKDLVIPAIQSLMENNWLVEDCFCMIELSKDETINSSLLDITNEKIYGDTKILLGRVKA